MAVSVGCPWGSNGPLERAGCDVRSIVTGCQNVCADHREASVRTGESTRPTSNRVILRIGTDNGTEYRRYDDGCRLEAVSVGGHPVRRPGESGKRYCVRK